MLSMLRVKRLSVLFLTFPLGGLNVLDSDVASIRRREDAEGDRYSCVKVQVDDLSMREHFSNTFQRTERISQEGSLLLEVEGRGKKTEAKVNILMMMMMMIVGVVLAGCAKSCICVDMWGWEKCMGVGLKEVEKGGGGRGRGREGKGRERDSGNQGGWILFSNVKFQSSVFHFGIDVDIDISMNLKSTRKARGIIPMQ
ncbi:hypothetical protein EYC80_009147 [Monilinia laxa]|uniref:Uncharacterized protein n=1 Tax=Monilinia laxa TaxID=61186 RepID=A0A5N6K2L4_MONLA|nr:hypothetical protein EYC80_009147 [Monilinia laxa]